VSETNIETASRNDKTTQEAKRPVAIIPAVSVQRRWYLPVKAAAEFLFALALLALASPLIAFLAFMVKLTSRGPAFYRQTRVGQYGQHFNIIKLRTMVDNCESLTGPRWCIPGDPRVTLVGRILRATHLDELPQLVNVLRGDMSIIGPRPERPEFLPKLERSLPGYRNRLLVRPGVTGLAQVQLPADTDLESVRRKLRYDLYYVEHMSPTLDVRILFCTGLYALGFPFRIAGTLFGVPGSALVEPAAETPMPEPALVRPRIAA
jgi:lipopolysaccharide/colanic/teichoic acid biosynthesis glycosyltransferase